VGEHHASPGSGTPADEGVSRAGGFRGGHAPVMLERCLELLEPALVAPANLGEQPVHVDATVGLGGHAEAVLAAHPAVRLVGLDRDPRALARATDRLAPYADRIVLEHAVYDELPEVLGRLALSTVDTILFDLGVSSMQLDDAERGFSYAQDAPLDMRMDPGTPITAEEVVNTYPVEELARVLRRYGEEKFAMRIAATIVRERSRARITSSARLADLVRDSIPAPARRTGGNPAKRTFQALRIEVNSELASLEAALPSAIDALTVGGRVVVLAYHSLEDRMVKRAFAGRATSSAPADLPVELPGTGPTLRLLTRGAELPDEAEVAANPRAASARLRAAERIEPDAYGPRPGAARTRTAMHQPRTRGEDRGGRSSTRDGKSSTRDKSSTKGKSSTRDKGERR
jgi:16S rRNA (cytosine1402-N4)-methyltransferase